MEKQKALDAIAKEIERCQVCRQGTSGMAVPGEGNPDAEIIFIGEAPGKQEAMTGKPFIGRSGKLLRSLIHEAGLKKEDVYITSPVKYLPDSGTPTQKDIDHGKLHFDKQIEIIDPKFIVLLGSVACKAVLEEAISVKQKHGEVIEKNNRKYFITIHPAAALRFPPFREIIKKDFEKLRTILNNIS